MQKRKRVSSTSTDTASWTPTIRQVKWWYHTIGEKHYIISAFLSVLFRYPDKGSYDRTLPSMWPSRILRRNRVSIESQRISWSGMSRLECFHKMWATYLQKVRAVTCLDSFRIDAQLRETSWELERVFSPSKLARLWRLCACDDHWKLVNSHVCFVCSFKILETCHVKKTRDSFRG